MSAYRRKWILLIRPDQLCLDVSLQFFPDHIGVQKGFNFFIEICIHLVVIPFYMIVSIYYGICGLYMYLIIIYWLL